MTECLFCKIVAKQIPADIVYEDETVLAFRDIRPQAPVHILIIPKKHIPTLNDQSKEDLTLMGHIMSVASSIASTEHIDQNGYRIVVNCNSMGGQEVYHLHYHLLGGRQMNWPPG